MSSVTERLSELSGDDAYYLKNLNSIESVNISYYQEIHAALKDSELLELLSSENWRDHLIAYVLILVGERTDMKDAIKQRIKSGSFVSPQLCVAMAILDKGVGKYFLGLIDKPELDSKVLGAVMSILPACYIAKVSMNGQEIDLNQFGVGFDAASNHFRFWRDRAFKP